MNSRPLLRILRQLPTGLLIGFSVALSLLLALGEISYRNIERQADATNWVEHTYRVAEDLRGILLNVEDVDNSVRTFVLTGVDAALQPYALATQTLPGKLEAMRSMVLDNPVQLARLKKLQSDIEQRLAQARLRVQQRRDLGAGALDAKYITPVALQLMESVRSDVALMTTAENQLLSARLNSLRTARRRVLVIQTVGGATSLILLLTVFAGLLKQILRANRAEQDAKRSNAQLEDANNEMRSFSYSVAHDLRAPLRAINGFARVIVEDHAACLPEEGQRVLGRITANATMMGQIIDDLLSLSKISYQPLKSSKVEMNELVRGAYHELAEAQTGRHIQLEIGNLPPAVGDPNLLRQVWINLIGNALKFTREQQRPLIEIGGNMAGPEFATYFIRDNGAGFDMQYANKLFGAFQRLHRPAEFEGTGIGLALVQRIIQRHGGTIWAEGQTGAGARFAFTLPEWRQG
jgi:signal transduction histidine kinase